MAKKISKGFTKTYNVGRYTITKTKSKDAASGKKTKTTQITKSVDDFGKQEPVFSRTKVKSPKYSVQGDGNVYGTIGRKKEKSTDYYIGGEKNMSNAVRYNPYGEYAASPNEKERGVKLKVSVNKTVQRLPRKGKAYVEEAGNVTRVADRSKRKGTARRVKTKETSINGNILKKRTK